MTERKAAGTWLGFDRDEIAYLAPMFSFLVFIWLGNNWKAEHPWTYPAAYVGRTICAAVLLIVFWKRYTPIKWDYWWLGIIGGVLGIIQWIGMDTLIQNSYMLFGEAQRHADGSKNFALWWKDFFALDPEKAFNPREFFTSPAAMWSWIAVRIIGASIVVPFMEELFWRDYLWRRIAAPNDFKLARVGEWDRIAFWVVALAFCIVHPQWLTAIGWGLMVGSLLLYTKSLGACIIMHGVTNLLLGLYVLKYNAWAWW